MIPYIEIRTSNAAGFYDEYEISDKDIEKLIEMVDDGYDQEALDIFSDEFMIPPSIKYQDSMSSYLGYSETGPMREKDQDKVMRNISLLSLGLSTLLINNFSKYLKKIHSESIFKAASITDKDLNKSIVNETLSEFDNLISGTMARTQGFILNGMRTLQREMIAENLLLKNSKIAGEVLEDEIIRFKNSLQIKYPEIYNAINKGNLMTTSKFIDGTEIVRHYKLDYYVDLSVRTTLLNVDRNVNVISALVNGESVVEYYLSDPRIVKKDREICQHILSSKTNGVSILALDEATGKEFGIMTVEEAKSTPDYAMGPYCRHSIRRCSAEYLKGLNNGNN